jgi:hypothetical protein
MIKKQERQGAMLKIVYPNGKTKALTFSYDDNQIHDRRLISLLNQYELCGTFHLNAGTIGTKNETDEYITWNELQGLYQGHEVACHGLHHPFFGQLPKGELLYELLEDKKQLEGTVKYPVRGMSYPFGEYSDVIINAAQTAGIEYSRTVEGTHNFGWPAEFLRWHPTCHHNEAFQNKELVDRFVNPPSYLNLPLFYIWGHSFEFHRENTWNAMELLCKQLSGRDEVWYATNIQIKEYICAIRSLVLSADQSMIYNPSAITVYFETNHELNSIKAGEVFYR